MQFTCDIDVGITVAVVLCELLVDREKDRILIFFKKIKK